MITLPLREVIHTDTRMLSAEVDLVCIANKASMKDLMWRIFWICCLAIIEHLLTANVNNVNNNSSVAVKLKLSKARARTDSVSFNSSLSLS